MQTRNSDTETFTLISYVQLLIDSFVLLDTWLVSGIASSVRKPHGREVHNEPEQEGPQRRST